MNWVYPCSEHTWFKKYGRKKGIMRVVGLVGIERVMFHWRHATLRVGAGEGVD
jgi:hypothetical protein